MIKCAKVKYIRRYCKSMPPSEYFRLCDTLIIRDKFGRCEILWSYHKAVPPLCDTIWYHAEGSMDFEYHHVYFISAQFITYYWGIALHEIFYLLGSLLRALKIQQGIFHVLLHALSQHCFTCVSHQLVLVWWKNGPYEVISTCRQWDPLCVTKVAMCQPCKLAIRDAT